MRQLQVWAPDAQSVELVDAKQASFAPQVMLTRTTVNYNGHDAIPGYWQTPAGVNVLNEGDGYWFRVGTDGGSTQFKMDPYARAMHYDTSWSIYKETDTFLWADQNHQPPPVGKMVIYQLFQGGYEGRGDGSWVDPATGANCGFTWTQNGTKGNFVQLRKKLNYIESLGVNTIELLPVNEFPGDAYIGYDSVSFFAIEASYGGVNGDGSSYTDLKAFINDAHSRGISVIADVVYNHIGADGDSGPLWDYDSYYNIYFSGELASNQEGGNFGMAPDWSRWDVQKYIEDSCRYYLGELHFDGLRFDFTSQIVNKNAGAGLDSGAEVLHRIIRGLKADFPSKILMCEHWDVSNNAYNPWMITYVGFDAGWFNLRENVQNALMPFAQGAESNLANGLNGGSYPSPFSRVVYANNHDECWWDGGPNQSKFWPVSQFGWRGDYWSQKKLRMMSALSFFVPGIPLFFMGDEFAMQGSFHDSDFNNILDWGLETDTLGNQFKAMFRSLIQIRQTYSQLTDPNTQFFWLQYPKDGWFAFKRKENGSVLIVAGNWTGDDMWNYGVSTNGETGNWTQIFNSDGQEFGGDGVGNFMNNPNSDAGSITINIPKNGIVVMNRTSV
jgi:1,4-alpha-glucan branching enzyme